MLSKKMCQTNKLIGMKVELFRSSLLKSKKIKRKRRGTECTCVNLYYDVIVVGMYAFYLGRD